MRLPHIKKDVDPTLTPSGTLSGVFGAVAAETPDPAAIASANAAHARYEQYEAKFEDSYRSRGMDAALDNMSFDTRKGLVAAAAKFGEIDEAADAGRAAVREIAADTLASNANLGDSAVAHANQELDTLQERITKQIAAAATKCTV